MQEKGTVWSQKGRTERGTGSGKDPGGGWLDLRPKRSHSGGDKEGRSSLGKKITDYCEKRQEKATQRVH